MFLSASRCALWPSQVHSKDAGVWKKRRRGCCEIIDPRLYVSIALYPVTCFQRSHRLFQCKLTWLAQLRSCRRLKMCQPQVISLVIEMLWTLCSVSGWVGVYRDVCHSDGHRKGDVRVEIMAHDKWCRCRTKKRANLRVLVQNINKQVEFGHVCVCIEVVIQGAMRWHCQFQLQPLRC
jgi:hypothetical protein